MKNMKINHLKSQFLILSLSIILMGCASSKHSKNNDFGKLIGITNKTYFVNIYGVPDKQVTIEPGLEAWEYRLNEHKFTSPTGYRFSTFEN